MVPFNAKKIPAAPMLPDILFIETIWQTAPRLAVKGSQRP